MMQRDQATAFATAETLMYRLPLLWAQMISPTAQGRAEIARMISEKQAAALNGIVAAQKQFMHEMMRFGFANPVAAWTRVMRASVQPATATVKANARRLRG